MPATETLTITLTTELAEKIRSRSNSGGYLNESEFLQEHLAEMLEPDSELELWLKTVGMARYDAYDANPADVLSGDQLRAALAERRQARSKFA